MMSTMQAGVPMMFSPIDGGALSTPTPVKVYGETRTTWTFNPWTGAKRLPADVQSDPFGILIIPPGASIEAAVKVAPVSGRALDTQVGGNHYKDMPAQPVEFIHANSLGYCEGAIIKYVCRFRKKNGIEDLKKARHYLDLLIDLESK